MVPKTIQYRSAPGITTHTGTAATGMGIAGYVCPLWVNSRHSRCKKYVRFTAESGHGSAAMVPILVKSTELDSTQLGGTFLEKS
jgi:hypothetical protein